MINKIELQNISIKNMPGNALNVSQSTYTIMVEENKDALEIEEALEELERAKDFGDTLYEERKKELEEEKNSINKLQEVNK